MRSYSGPTRERLTGLQALRAIAALAVVHFHTGLAFGNWHHVGAFGVDIFFTLSGFLMAKISVEDRSAFLLRRAIRIVPSYWLLTVISAAALLAFPVSDPASPRGVLPLVRSLCFIPYYRIDGTIFPVLVPGWSLNYEMCFYLLVALALLLSTRWVSSLTIAFVLLLMATARCAHSGTFHEFYGNGIMLEFIAGILSYYVYRWADPGMCRRLTLLLYGVGICSLLSLAFYEGTRFYTSSGSRFWLGTLAFVLVQCTVLLARSGHDIRNRFLILIGDSSYTLYLIHFFIISLFHRFITSRIPTLAPNRPLGSLVATLICVLASIAVFGHFEQPMHLQLTKFFMRDRRTKAVPNPLLAS
jgi:exopolysaccharide production protein ExoZ